MAASAQRAAAALARPGFPAGAARGTRRRPARWPQLAIAGLHLAVLWSFAIVQPLFSDLARNAEFFVARGNTATDILLFAFGLVLLPPAAMLLVEVGAAFLRPGLARAIHLAFVTLLVAAAAIGLLKRVLPDTSVVLLPAVGLLGAGAAVAYARSPALRSVLTVLAAAPAVFLASFLLFSPVSQLIGGGQDRAVASAVPRSTPVVLVIFDELPTISLMDARRRIDDRRLPSFGRLGATSTWYRNATTVADGTWVAVPAILTGRRPAQRLPTSRQYPNSVFTLVGRRHAIHALEPLTHVCPARLCGQRPRDDAEQRLGALASDLTVFAGHIVLPGDIAQTLPPIDRGYEDFDDEGDDITTNVRGPGRPAGGRTIAGSDKFSDLLRDMERFVGDVRRPKSRPPLYMGHFEVPHVPWRLLPSGRQYPVHGTTLPGLHDQTWSRDRFIVAQATQRHMLQVSYADRLLGRLIRRLQRAGLWDEALVVVTADHGVGLRPGGSRRAVTGADFAGIAGVPLFVKLPRQRRPAVVEGAARTVDILPTIADAIGVRTPPGVDGRSLTKPLPAVVPSVRSGRRGRFVSMALGAFERARDAELARQRRLFPDPLNLFRTSLDKAPVGRRVRSRKITGAGTVRARIDGAKEFRRVSFRSGVLPVYVTGRFTSGGRPGMRLAFAVNGRIVAGGRSYPVGRTVRFSGLVPATSLRSGANRITVFVIRGGKLAPIARAGG